MRKLATSTYRELVHLTSSFPSWYTDSSKRLLSLSGENKRACFRFFSFAPQSFHYKFTWTGSTPVAPVPCKLVPTDPFCRAFVLDGDTTFSTGEMAYCGGRIDKTPGYMACERHYGVSCEQGIVVLGEDSAQ